MKICRFCGASGFTRPNSTICFTCMPTGLTEVQRRIKVNQLERLHNPIILDCRGCNSKFELPYGQVNRKYCYSCMPTGLTKIQQNSRLRFLAKRKIVQLKGGSCQSCGFDKYLASLELHHLEEDSKEFNIGNRLNSPIFSASMLAELEKCILLCSNCHRAYHSGELILNI